MDILKSKTVTGHDGGVMIPIMMNRDKIIKVSRQGEQKDFTPFLSFGSMDGNQWSFISGGVKRIVFKFPFVGEELIHIIYKL